MRNYILLALSLVALSGCASKGLYDWGGYEDSLFDYYHQPETKLDLIEDLVEHVEYLMEYDEKPAPGLLAEVGTFYLLEGDRQRAVYYYRLEAQEWPDSQPMMAKLIKNLER
ncbi:DUF4810 domain-containing protein [Salinibius halmophilus]|uniref:DUF4810 domain-containing protein n=1 Tax=Salinibius halmophilus TaxID=1853216 RepID=UPI000E662BCC|nr:DUF4810 domain-containing protein [Salinibius halmophilus]